MSSLSFSEFEVCDRRNERKLIETIGDYDVILLAGGHVLTQNAFFRRINLKNLIRDYKGIIIGISAGSMNCADIVICTNTMHKVVPQIQKQISIHILHIADATADALIEAGIKKVALLGTKYTMMQDFYKEKLIARGISVMIPNEEDIELVNSVIYDELCLGVVSDTSRNQYIRIIGDMKEEGAEGVVLGCTEIGLLIHQEDSSLPIFDTTYIHARAAALKAID